MARLPRELRVAADAAARVEEAMRRRDDAIRAAHPAHSLQRIADAVGLSKPRVQQIVNEGRAADAA